jgi:adenylosuccinate synthase
MPVEFQELAAYNTRVSQGVLHTPEFVARMAGLQGRFEEWVVADDRRRRSGG